VEASPSATAQAVAAAPDSPDAANSDQPTGEATQSGAGYILFGVLVVLLVAGLAALQLWQRR
jgi:hypothetical protein